MATKVLMPQLGESVTEGTISKWLVKVGDVVQKYDALAEVATDKVNAEVPSTVAGKVTEIVVPEGETVSVGTLILYIEEAGSAAAEPSADTVIRQESGMASGQHEQTAASAAAKQRFSPAVLRLAQEHNIDLTLITGTGAGGRITRKDVQQVIEQGGQKSTAQTAPAPRNSPAVYEEPSVKAPAISTPTPSIPKPSQGDLVIPVTPLRKTIAARMTQSKQEIPHAWTMVEVDVTNLVKLRNRWKTKVKEQEGINLTFLPFFIKAVVEALKEYPMMNSTWQGEQIVVRKDVNISIAVATEDALFVPVIKNADQKSVFGIAKAVEELAAKTRAGKLTLDDMSGGTFTVNNTGSFGSVLSVPIINPPQAAILSVEAIVKRPVVIEDMIAIRSMVNLCLSLDHRILDGLVCGRFLQSVKQKLENIGPDTPIY